MAGWNTVIIERPFPRFRSSVSCGLALALALAVAACGSHRRDSVPVGTSEPDKFLFDKGTDALNNNSTDADAGGLEGLSTAADAIESGLSQAADAVGNAGSQRP